MCHLQIGVKGTAKSVNKKKKTLIFFKRNFRKAQKRGENVPKCPKIEGNSGIGRKKEENFGRVGEKA